MWDALLNSFNVSLGHLNPTTRRSYSFFARALAKQFRDVSPESITSDILEEWYSSLSKQRQTLYRLRSKRFIRFIEESCGMNLLPQVSRPEIARADVDNAWSKAMERAGEANLSIRQDLALLAAFCATTGSLSRAVHLNRSELRVLPALPIVLSNKPVTDTRLNQTLYSWHRLRLRLDNPHEQARFRRTPEWAASSLLFPGAKGMPLSRSSIPSAVRRLLAVPGLTPVQLREHFGQ
jgi:hypothetical protein